MLKIHPSIRWSLTIAFAVFIHFISSRPMEGLPSINHIDKVAHFVVYFLFSASLIWSLKSTKFAGNASIYILGAVIATAYGAFEEVHQSFVPGRYSEVMDGVANAIGAIAAALLFFKAFMRDRKGETAK